MPLQIRKGERIILSLLSSIAAENVYAVARLRYDNGKPDTLYTPAFTTGSSRAGESRVSDYAKENGVVEDAFVNGSVLGQRGRTYVRLVIENGGLMCSGYLYSNHTVQLGEHTEAGPGGGSGYVYQVETADPAAAAEVAAMAVPTNAMWRLLTYSVSMAQGITQTPHPALQILDKGAARTLALIPIGADIAASTTVRCSWIRAATDTRNNVTSGAMVAALPDMLLVATDTLDTLTEGIGAASDYGVARAYVEEWLVGIA